MSLLFVTTPGQRRAQYFSSTGFIKHPIPDSLQPEKSFSSRTSPSQGVLSWQVGSDKIKMTPTKNTNLSNILYANPTADLYGASQSLLDLIAHLDRRLYHAVVLVPSDGPLVPLLQAHDATIVIEPDLAVVRRGTVKGPSLFRLLTSLLPSVWKCVKHIRKHGTAVVHTNTALIVTPAIASRICGVPHVWHVRETFNEFPRLWAAYSRLIVWFSSCVVCNSTAVRNQFGKLLVKHKKSIVTILNGLDVERFDRAIKKRESIVERFAPNKEALIVCIGRINSWKGQEILIASYSLIKDKLGPTKLLIVGDTYPGNEACLRDLRTLVHKLGLEADVVFTGFIGDIPSLLSACALFVLPSTNPEPFGRVILEAMAMRVPVIATNAGGPLDIIQDGVSGILVPPGDRRALAGAIQQVMTGPPERCVSMRESARERVIRCFSAESTTAAIESVYRSLLTKKRGARDATRLADGQTAK
jgi:glycosyltransferase involved in cell wall biosynthesis